MRLLFGTCNRNIGYDSVEYIETSKKGYLITSSNENVNGLSMNENSLSEYQRHGLYFKIPNGLNIKEILENNNVRIILSDNISTVQIDLIDYTNSRLDTALSMIDTNQREINHLIRGFYETNIVTPVTKLTSSGSGISILPDGIDCASVATNYEERHQDIEEWIIAWTKHSYKKRFMGIYALIKRPNDVKYSYISIKWPGSNIEYWMPKLLAVVLSTIKKLEHNPEDVVED